MESVENENYKPPVHATEDGLERDAAVTEKLVAPGDGTKITFTTSKADGKDQNGDAKIEIQGVESQFVGLSKEELMKYANDPFWVRLRMTLFVLFWVLWIAMLVGAVAIIVLTPRCAPPPQLAWWQSSPVYNVEVAAFADSDGNDRGDVAGLASKLDYIKGLGMGTLLLSDIFAKDAAGATVDYTTVEDGLGSVADVEALLNATKEQDMHVVLAINPAYLSQQHQWFADSRQGKEGFQDLFVWHKADQGAPPPEGQMPSGESAWTYDDARGAFYLHQSAAGTADVNWKSPQALQLFTGVLRFWLDKGVSGFLVYNTFLDRTSPAQSTLGTESDVLDLLTEWRQVLGNYSSAHVTAHRLLAVQVDRSPSEASPLYGSAEEPAADLVLSKAFERHADKSNATSLRVFVQGTLDATPEGRWPSFVLGGSVFARLAERAGVLLDGLHMVAALVQGTPVFYYGDEIGQECSVNPPCKMVWNEDAATTPGVSVEAQSGNSSHLEVVRGAGALRDKLAVRLGSTVTSVLGANSTVFVMLRVRKGTPGFMAVVNGDDQQVTVNLADASSHVPESGHIEVKSTHSAHVLQSKVKLNEFALEPYEAVIVQFVPIFE